jgi:hypothetical protein
MRQMLLGGMLLAMPLAASGCVIPIGNGCNLLLFEPGVQIGVVCNPF